MSLYTVIANRILPLPTVVPDDLVVDAVQFDSDLDIEAVQFGLTALHAGYTVQCFLNGEPIDMNLEVVDNFLN